MFVECSGSVRGGLPECLLLGLLLGLLERLLVIVEGVRFLSATLRTFCGQNPDRIRTRILRGANLGEESRVQPGFWSEWRNPASWLRVCGLRKGGSGGYDLGKLGVSSHSGSGVNSTAQPGEHRQAVS